MFMGAELNGIWGQIKAESPLCAGVQKLRNLVM